jgi:hypothetical protein
VAEAKVRFLWDEVDLRYAIGLELAQGAPQMGCETPPDPPATTRPLLIDPTPDEVASAAVLGREQLDALVRWHASTRRTLDEDKAPMCFYVTHRFAQDHTALPDLEDVPQYRYFKSSKFPRRSLNTLVYGTYPHRLLSRHQHEAIALAEREPDHPDRLFTAELWERGLSPHYRALLWQDTLACDAAVTNLGGLGAFGTSGARLEEMGLPSPPEFDGRTALHRLEDVARSNGESREAFLARCPSAQVDEFMAEYADDPRAYGATLVPHVADWIEETERHFRRGHRSPGEAVLLTITAWRAGRSTVDDWTKRAGAYWSAPPGSLTWVQVYAGAMLARTDVPDPKEARRLVRAAAYLPHCLAWSVAFSEDPEEEP